MGVQAAALHQAVLKHWLESDKFYTHLDPRGGVFTPSYNSVFPALLAQVCTVLVLAQMIGKAYSMNMAIGCADVPLKAWPDTHPWVLQASEKLVESCHSCNSAETTCREVRSPLSLLP